MVNDVSRCELTPEAQKRLCRSENDFPEVVVKFFTTNPRFPYCPVQRAVINTLLSAYDLSPHLIYIDAHVSVQQGVSNVSFLLFFFSSFLMTFASYKGPNAERKGQF